MEKVSDVEVAYRIKAVNKEPWTVKFIESIDPKTGVFYDIGANVGPYSLIAASRGVATVAVEPSFSNYAALCRNLALNNILDQLVVVPLAISSGHGLLWFKYQDMRQGAANHILSAEQKNPYFHQQKMLVLKLDELIGIFSLPMPTHIKVDTDGGELDVLKGAEQVLASKELQGLMVEMPTVPLHPDTTETAEQQITAYLAEHGWDLVERFDHRGDVKIGSICYGRFA